MPGSRAAEQADPTGALLLAFGPADGCCVVWCRSSGVTGVD
jgi:hypothetical protein